MQMRKDIDTFRKEAEQALRVMYSLLQFKKALTNPSDVKAVNKNAYFWRLFEDTFQSQMFIGIRRLYENESGTFNVQTFINRCRDNVTQFSKNSLKRRKLSSGNNAKDWIDDYMLEIYEPSSDNFHRLSALIRQNSKNIKKLYVPAASKVYAHAVYTKYEDINSALSGLDFDEIEMALTSVWHVYNQIWQLYENGREPKYEITSYPYRVEVFNMVLNQIRTMA